MRIIFLDWTVGLDHLAVLVHDSEPPRSRTARHRRSAGSLARLPPPGPPEVRHVCLRPAGRVVRPQPDHLFDLQPQLFDLRQVLAAEGKIVVVQL